MTGKTPPSRPSKQSEAEARDARLKAALKANMARRKAQARARSTKDIADDKSEG